jgi:hypothetical protein
MPEFRSTFEAVEGDHNFAILACESLAEGDLVDELAAELRALYSDVEDVAERLRRQAQELGDVADESRINATINRVLEASIPPPGQHKVVHLDVARNELAELLAHLVVQHRFDAVVPASRIRHKEIPGAPARGLDLLALELDPLKGLASEVKASSQAISPPAVVGSGADSLRGQFLDFLGDEDRMLAELNRLYKQAPEENLDAIARAMLECVEGSFEIALAPVLLRSENHAADTDFGCFKDEADDFDGREIRFSVICVVGPIEDLAKAVYEKARE